jgi:hypothetical protein
LAKAFYHRQRPARERLASYIAQRIADGAFRPIDAPLAARAFIGMLSHHGLMKMLYGDDFLQIPVEQIVEGMVDIFLRGISVTPERHE